MKLSTTELMTRLIGAQPVSAALDRVNHVVRLLQDYLDEAGVCTAVEILDGRQILYAATGTGKTADVLFNAHLDVVPAEADMFSLRRDGDWLCGRGTHDCLGNAALIANLLIRLGSQANVAAVFSTDEEVGGLTTKAMVERGYGARRLVIVMDGRGYSLALAQKGILSLRLVASGLACHAAEPWKGENAIDRLLDGYAKVRPLFPHVAPPEDWQNTMAATLITAGTVVNRVPDTAEMTLNIRFTGAADAERITREIAAASGLQVYPKVDCLPLAFSPDTPALQELMAFMEKTLRRPITIERMNGATDARHFAALGVPVAIIGVPGRDAHGRNEAIDLAGLAAYEDMLEAYCRQNIGKMKN